MENSDDPNGLKVFVSYSRADLAFADQLVEFLRDSGFNPILDRHDIDPSENWKDRLASLIFSCDTVLFVLSATFAESEVCKWEVSEADRLGKRMIPIAIAPVLNSKAPERLAVLNYILFYSDPKKPGSGFYSGSKELQAALVTDLDWLRLRTRLHEQAYLWERRNSSNAEQSSLLLRGNVLEEAKEWASRTPAHESIPQVVEAFVRASELEEARIKAEAEAQIREKEASLVAAKSALAKQQKAEKVLRRVGFVSLVIGLVLSVVAIIGGASAWIFSQAANSAKQSALEEAERAQVAENEALAKAEEARAATEAANEARSVAEKFLDAAISRLPSSWASDKESPDYAHFSGIINGDESSRGEFLIDASDLRELSELNHIKIEDGSHAIFLIRGAKLGSGLVFEQAQSIRVRDERPDHYEARCLLIIVDWNSQQLTAVSASTVPSDFYMRQMFSSAGRAELKVEGFGAARFASLLATGSHQYKVGSMRAGRNDEMPGILRQAEPAPVRRTRNNLTYETSDEWVFRLVGAHIIPTFYPNPRRTAPMHRSRGEITIDASIDKLHYFMSSGSISVAGSVRNAERSGPFARVQEILSIPAPYQDLEGAWITGSEGKSFQVQLFTGSDLLAADKFGDQADLRRLRFGSSGPEVRTLQEALGLVSDGIMGLETVRALVDLQIEKTGVSDGIYSPHMDSLFGFCVFSAC